MIVFGYTDLGRVVGVSIADSLDIAETMLAEASHTLVASEGAPMTGGYVDVSVQPHVVRAQIEAPVALIGTTITGIPCAATIEIDGEYYHVDAGDLELNLDEPGRHWARLECDDPRYRTWHTEITV